MIFFIVAAVMAACAVSTAMPLRAGAVCTPSTHRARQTLGLLCGVLALVGVSRFVRFVALGDHPVNLDVVVGQTVSLVFAAHAVILWRGVFLPTTRAVTLILVSVVLMLAGVARGVRSLDAGSSVVTKRAPLVREVGARADLIGGAAGIEAQAPAAVPPPASPTR